MPKYIAHMIPEYLGHTLNWLYTQLKYVKRYEPYIMTQRTKNLDAYPLDRIFVSRNPQSAGKPTSYYERLVRRLGFQPPVDFRCYSAAMRELPPIFLHAHFGWDGFFALGLKRKHHLPLVTRFYGYDVGILPRIPLWRRRYARLFEEGDLFIVEGTNMKAILTGLGCPEDKIVVHHLGTELDRIAYAPREPKPGMLRVLIAGTFKEKKGIEYALRALSQTRERLPKLRIATTVIGDGVLKEPLHALAGELGIEQEITWTGYQPHDFFLDALHQADLFLSPSVTAANGDTEGGAPVAIIEAGASGLPVVSTTHADIPEVVLHDKTGLLAPERNSDALTEFICRLALEPETRLKFGEQARKHIEKNYEAAQQGRRLEEIYSRFEN
ncbi:glycosyltransferase [Candidatus Sumerlaeota bacterium]|nr:glycosyltransferase [Candidatus Sumerlaeota bacterium]